MPSKFRQWIRDKRRSYQVTDPAELTTPEGRARAAAYDKWWDVGFLRTGWTNLREFAPGAWRSNQPPEARIRDYAARGIRTVITLRGDENPGINHLVSQACAAHGITWVSARLQARYTTDPDKIQDVIEKMRKAEKPVLIHCKSGADRAGLAAVLYRLVILGHPLAEARRELSLRTLHVRKFRTGVLDFMLDKFAESGQPFETWLHTTYDHAAIQAEFNALPWYRR